jgi:hypothetical protein
MQLTTALAALALPLSALAHDTTVLGAFVFHRHGDRTEKAHKPTRLTELGYRQVYEAGSYFRAKYIDGESGSRISGISEKVVTLSQLDVEAPVDAVLQNSAQGFLQGLYPPVQSVQTLANGTKISAPLNGYQLIPVNIVSSASTAGSDAENTAWLQGLSGCPAAVASSNAYFESEEFSKLQSETKEFFQSLQPVVEGTFDVAYTTYKNAYSVFDIINVATINNSTIPHSDLLSEETLLQLRTLADKHEFGLAYNASSEVRAIAGATLAAQILEHLDEMIKAEGKTNKLGIQFGAYATFLSFFGLSGLTSVNENFTGLPDYGSAMTFELLTDADVSGGFPAVEDLSVQFLFNNGSAAFNGQTAFPLFGGEETVIPYTTFVTKMNEFAIGGGEKWCQVCGVTDGTCAQYLPAAASTASVESGKGGMSLAVAGVIGAMVTLVVILGSQALIVLVGGLRLVSKKRLAAQDGMARHLEKSQSA